MDPADGHKVLSELSVWIGPILMRYRVTHLRVSLRKNKYRSSGPGVRTVRGQPEFTGAIGFTFSVSQRRFSGRRK